MNFEISFLVSKFCTEIAEDYTTFANFDGCELSCRSETARRRSLITTKRLVAGNHVLALVRLSASRFLAVQVEQ